MDQLQRIAELERKVNEAWNKEAMLIQSIQLTLMATAVLEFNLADVLISERCPEKIRKAVGPIRHNLNMLRNEIKQHIKGKPYADEMMNVLKAGTTADRMHEMNRIIDYSSQLINIHEVADQLEAIIKEKERESANS